MIKEKQRRIVAEKQKEEKKAKTMREHRKKEIDEKREKSKKRKNHDTCMETHEEKEDKRQAESAVIKFLWKINGQDKINQNDSDIHFIDSKEILQKRMAKIHEAEEKIKEDTKQVKLRKGNNLIENRV